MLSLPLALFLALHLVTILILVTCKHIDIRAFKRLAILLVLIELLIMGYVDYKGYKERLVEPVSNMVIT